MLKKKAEKVLTKTVEDIARHSVNIGCYWILHQPRIPNKVVEKYKKY